MRKLVSMVIIVFLWSSSVALAQVTEKGEALCYEIQHYVNALVDFTETSCLPAGGNSKGSLSFIIVSSEPVFSVEASKKAWLLGTIAAAGMFLNQKPSVNAGDLCLSDAALVKNRTFYIFPASLAKSLQRKIKKDQISLEEMYNQIKINLIRKIIKKK